jgi:hypothetical protein
MDDSAITTIRPPSARTIENLAHDMAHLPSPARGAMER